MEVLELPDEPEPGSPALYDAVLKKEAARVLRAMEGFDHTVALCVEGKAPDSPAFSQILAGCEGIGRSLCFVIGGSLGLAGEVKARAGECISLSRLTFPHRLARICLLYTSVLCQDGQSTIARPRKYAHARAVGIFY